jgi:hypothetical protein
LFVLTLVPATAADDYPRRRKTVRCTLIFLLPSSFRSRLQHTSGNEHVVHPTARLLDTRRLAAAKD